MDLLSSVYEEQGVHRGSAATGGNIILGRSAQRHRPRLSTDPSAKTSRRRQRDQEVRRRHATRGWGLGGTDSAGVWARRRVPGRYLMMARPTAWATVPRGRMGRVMEVLLQSFIVSCGSSHAFDQGSCDVRYIAQGSRDRQPLEQTQPSSKPSSPRDRRPSCIPDPIDHSCQERYDYRMLSLLPFIHHRAHMPRPNPTPAIPRNSVAPKTARLNSGSLRCSKPSYLDPSSSLISFPMLLHHMSVPSISISGPYAPTRRSAGPTRGHYRPR